jgi:hypothetical protein
MALSPQRGTTMDTTDTTTATPEVVPTFSLGDRVVNRPGSWDRGQIPGRVRGTHTYDDGRVLVHVNHDDGSFTSWYATELAPEAS